jgi:hypothetical protein
MVVHYRGDTSTQEVEAERFRIWGQPGYVKKSVSKNKQQDSFIECFKDDLSSPQTKKKN